MDTLYLGLFFFCFFLFCFFSFSSGSQYEELIIPVPWTMLSILTHLLLTRVLCFTSGELFKSPLRDPKMYQWKDTFCSLCTLARGGRRLTHCIPEIAAFVRNNSLNNCVSTFPITSGFLKPRHSSILGHTFHLGPGGREGLHNVGE